MPRTRWNPIHYEPKTILGTTNSIVNIIENDCDVPWSVMVELAKETSGLVLQMLLVPSPEEIVEEFLTAKYGPNKRNRFRRHDKSRRSPTRGGKLRRAASEVFDVDGGVAKRLAALGGATGRKVGPKQYFFWTAFDLAERGAFYWMLYDAFKDWVFLWNSSMVESIYCNHPIDIAGRWELPFGHYGATAGLLHVPPAINEYSHGFLSWTANHVNFVVDSSMSVWYWQSWQNFGTGTWAVHSEIRGRDDAGNITLDYEQDSTLEPGQTVSHSTFKTSPKVKTLSLNSWTPNFSLDVWHQWAVQVHASSLT